MKKRVFKEISTNEAVDFRLLHMPRMKFIYDEWDESSLHFGCYLEDNLAGTIRLTTVRENRLPFQSLFPEVTLSENDIEIGRLLVAKKFRAGRIAYEIINSIYKFWFENWYRFGDVYVALSLKGNIKPRSYENYGLQPTGKPVFINKGRMQVILMKRKKRKNE